MRIHHLNCVTSCPLGGRLMDSRSPGVLQRGALCCHCLLVESGSQLVLIDTGFGLKDVRDPRSRLSAFFLKLVSPDFSEEHTAIRQIERLGFSPRDVRHIVLTHLDFDHAGGLDDFPWARVHMMRTERDDAAAQRSWLDRQRYRPQQWNFRERWEMHDARRGNDWLGFMDVSAVEGIVDDILLVPLAGHTLGHAGIAIRDHSGWLLHAGDAYFFHREMDPEDPWCTPGLRAYQWMMEKDRNARLANQEKLRSLRSTRQDVRVVCGHDPIEFERVAGRPMSELPARVPRDCHSDRSPRAGDGRVSGVLDGHAPSQHTEST
jgi:glyoxylase-like metal-dependent hydrolase (beta-lactamase superfamily II)